MSDYAVLVESARRCGLDSAGKFGVKSRKVSAWGLQQGSVYDA